MVNFIEELKWRGLYNNSTAGAEEFIKENPDKVHAYIGFDPTAPSLGIGNLVQIAVIKHLINAGHRGKVVIILGGATAQVGDPSGKTKTRVESGADIYECLGKIEKQILSLLPEANIELVDNAEFYWDYNIFEFLDEVASNFNLRNMLAKASVVDRLASEEGMTAKEFMYQMFQAHDFYHLSEIANVNLQIGGSDQWGNITAGTELIRKKGGVAHGITTNLITKSDGSKFGKSEEGNIWLDPEMTSPYQFYQFWYNLSDIDAERMLKIFAEDRSFIERKIEDWKTENYLQGALADLMTTWIHGHKTANEIIAVNRMLYGRKLGVEYPVMMQELWDLAKEVIYTVDYSGRKKLFTEDTNDLYSLLFAANIVNSKTKLMREIKSGNLYINGFRVNYVEGKHLDEYPVDTHDLVFDKYLLIEIGKKDKSLIILT